MTPDRQPLALDVDRVEWLPSSPEALEVRVFGAWRAATVPPAVELVVGTSRTPAFPDAPPAGAPPAWSAAFPAPIEARAALEAGEAFVEAGGVRRALPAAVPGALDPDDGHAGGTLVDPAVLAERRTRRAELAEESASERAATAEQTVETLRTQLGHLEERLAGVTADRDRLAARVADAERRLRLAEQREEAERRRRAELEEETLAARRDVEAELTELRVRLAGAEDAAAAIEHELDLARRRQVEAERAATTERTARRAVEAALAQARQRLEALQLAAEGTGAEDLRARLAEAEHAAERSRTDLAALRSRLAAAEASREEVDDLRRRLRRADAERLQLEERAARAEEELTAGAGVGERERALAEQVAALEAELARRTSTHVHVQEAIVAVREELARVRAQVDAGHAAGAASRVELERLDERRRALEAALRERDAALDELREGLEETRSAAAAARTDADEHRAALAAARHAVGDLQERLDVERRARAAAEAALAKAGADAGRHRRAPLEARLHELAAEVAGIRARLGDATADLERRLAEERARREAAEATLAAAATAATAAAERPADRLHAPEVRPDVDPAAAPDRPSEVGPDVAPDVEQDEAPVRPDADPDAGQLDPSLTFPSTGDDALDALIAGLRDQIASARDDLETWGAEPPHAEDPPRRAAQPSAEPEPPIDDVTRRRLAAIEAELRAAVPDASAPTPARDVIASLQRAADRLRTAAEEELGRIEDDAPPSAAARPAAILADTAPVAVDAPGVAHDTAPVALGARPLARTREQAWLRTGLERLAAVDAHLAGELVVALLPAQALVADGLTYDLSAPDLGTVRVMLGDGIAHVERPPASPQPAEATVAGDLHAVAPLAAGGASWRLPGLRVDRGARRIRRLAWARRRPVSLGDLQKVSPPPDPRLLLAALAATVEPEWTAGHAFAVAYAFSGDGRWAVVVQDGAPLHVLRGDDGVGDAVVHAGREALLALLAGSEPPAGAPATVHGDRRAADQLHAWFDRARGVAAR